MIGNPGQKAYITGFPYGHNKAVARTKASQRRAAAKLGRARRIQAQRGMDKGRKTIAEIEEAIGVKP